MFHPPHFHIHDILAGYVWRWCCCFCSCLQHATAQHNTIYGGDEVGGGGEFPVVIPVIFSGWLAGWHCKVKQRKDESHSLEKNRLIYIFLNLSEQPFYEKYKNHLFLYL